MTPPTRICLGLLALGLSGCATIGTLGESHTRNKVYSGTIRDVQLECAHGTCLDIPFSFVADTAVLPATIPWSLYNVCHEEPKAREEPVAAQSSPPRCPPAPDNSPAPHL
ncbi:MAG TPA: hypothetical protein VNU68_08200 [Verrucomicrobiae bacterium]|nr:hypothetical protein [Verrucomicrobiae bacterium]